MLATGPIDDLSYVRRDQTESSVLFELNSERYERKSIVCSRSARPQHSTHLEKMLQGYPMQLGTPKRKDRL
jgi:hypothetical protein